MHIKVISINQHLMNTIYMVNHIYYINKIEKNCEVYNLYTYDCGYVAIG